MIYYCDDLPHPTREHEAFIEKGVERLLAILSISNGKALVLFTAKTDMEEVYSCLLYTSRTGLSLVSWLHLGMNYYQS